MIARTLVTFPGRHGDLLWALPTIRALAEVRGEAVDLLICGEFAGLVPLLQIQPYLAAVRADETWGIGMGWQPTTQYGPYEAVYHLGYRRWPELPLPEETQRTLQAEYAMDVGLDLTRPWITPPPWEEPRDLVFGWTDCYFELKYGLTELLAPDEPDAAYVNVIGIVPPGSRWVTEGGYLPTSWLEAAAWISRSRALLTDCSALHVLAVGLGIPVVVVEPMEARWNPIFYPLGMDGPPVTVVKGTDGRPTFDSRHCRETLTRILTREPV